MVFADNNADGRVSVNELIMAVNAALAGCLPSATPTATPDPNGPDAQPFDSTFAAIQKNIFERYSCTQAVCHGSAAKQATSRATRARITALSPWGLPG